MKGKALFWMGTIFNTVLSKGWKRVSQGSIMSELLNNLCDWTILNSLWRLLQLVCVCVCVCACVILIFITEELETALSSLILCCCRFRGWKLPKDTLHIRNNRNHQCSPALPQSQQLDSSLHVLLLCVRGWKCLRTFTSVCLWLINTKSLEQLLSICKI